MTFLTTTRIAALCLTCLGGTVAAASDTATMPAFDLMSAARLAMVDVAAPTETGIKAFLKSDDMAKRGRGRGRGGDDDRNDNRDDWDDRDDDRDDDRSGRDKPRVPGGSGCDDPGDIAEHAECSPGGGTVTPPPSNGDDSGSGRDKPRIPGGSGCDDPGDVIEHPECRG